MLEVIRGNKWTVLVGTSGSASGREFREKEIFEHTTSPDGSVQRQTRNKNVVTRDASIFIFVKRRGQPALDCKTEKRMQALEGSTFCWKRKVATLCLPSKRGARNNLRLDHPACLPCLPARSPVRFFFCRFPALPCRNKKIIYSHWQKPHMEAKNLLAASWLLDPPSCSRSLFFQLFRSAEWISEFLSEV